MSNTKVINILDNKIIKQDKYDYLKVKDIIINNLYELFGVKLIGVDFNISVNNLSNDFLKAEIIGYDEEYRITIFEFRKEKYGPLIKKSLMAIDYINEHSSIFNTLIKEYIDSNDFNNLNYNARLIIIGEDFSESDNYALKQLPYLVDLVSAKIYSNNLIIEKMYSSFQVRIEGYNMLMKNDLFKRLHEDIMELGSEVSSTGTKGFINYRRIKNFSFVLVNNDIKVFIRNNKKLENLLINNDNYLEILEKIKIAYEEN